MFHGEMVYVNCLQVWCSATCWCAVSERFVEACNGGSLMLEKVHALEGVGRRGAYVCRACPIIVICGFVYNVKSY